jgi:hypothetical protein
MIDKKKASKKKAGKKTKQAKVAAKAQSAVGTTQHRPPLEYRVVSSQNVNTFQNDVNTMLEAGEWYLAGGISVMTVAKVGTLYTQALYRY